MSVIFRGSTAACLAHLVDATGDDYLETRKALSAFARVGGDAVYRWTARDKLPVGEVLVRLRFYLELHGYEVTELTVLKKPICDVGRCFAFGVVSIKEVAKLLDYPSGASGVSMTLSLFRGATKTTASKLELLALLAEEKAEVLERARKRTAQIVIPHEAAKEETVLQKVDAEEEPSEAAVHPPVSRLRSRKQDERSAVIESFAGSVKALIPLARVLVSDDFTPGERAKVRELAGGDGVFTLANALFSLCSETSRKKRA